MSTTVSYKGVTIATADNNTKVLNTKDTWLEDNITLVDTTSGGGGGITPTGTKQISITENGTTTEDVTNYANAEITVNVSGGGSASIDSFVDGTVPTGATTLQTATTIMDYGLAKRTGMTSLSAPNVTRVGAYALSDCTGLTSVSFPTLTQLSGDYAFSGCTQLTSVAFPSFTGQTRSRTFNNCSSLAVADLGNCTQVANQTFNGSSALRTLVLRKTDAVCPLATWNQTTIGGIYNNPTASTIYVPSALISSYQSSGNWTTAYNAGVTFSAIEGSIYE